MPPARGGSRSGRDRTRDRARSAPPSFTGCASSTTTIVASNAMIQLCWSASFANEEAGELQHREVERDAGGEKRRVGQAALDDDFDVAQPVAHDRATRRSAAAGRAEWRSAATRAADRRRAPTAARRPNAKGPAPSAVPQAIQRSCRRAVTDGDLAGTRAPDTRRARPPHERTDTTCSARSSSRSIVDGQRALASDARPRHARHARCTRAGAQSQAGRQSMQRAARRPSADRDRRRPLGNTQREMQQQRRQQRHRDRRRPSRRSSRGDRTGR